MSALSDILRSADGGRILFFCPGCESVHQVHVGEGPGPRWSYNNDPKSPTFYPSILLTWKEPSDNPDEFDDESKDVPKTCHSFVRGGLIQFLGDCTHALAGQTVRLPNFTWGS